jgi:hypothetical protein
MLVTFHRTEYQISTYSPTLTNNSTQITLQVHRCTAPNTLVLSGGSCPRFLADRLIHDNHTPHTNMIVIATTVNSPRTWCPVRNCLVCHTPRQSAKSTPLTRFLQRK